MFGLKKSDKSPMDLQGSPIDAQGSPLDAQGSPLDAQGSPLEAETANGSYAASRDERTAPNASAGGAGAATGDTAGHSAQDPSKRHPQDKKGVRTPTRREREAARKRPLVLDPAEAKTRQREERALQAERVRTAFRTGDERYLPLKHKGANRRLIRSVIDERFHISETLIFVTSLFLVVSLIFQTNLQLQQLMSNIFFGYFLLLVIDMIFTVRTVRKRQKEAGLAPERGDLFYIIERNGMFGRFRTPAKGV